MYFHNLKYLINKNPVIDKIYNLNQCQKLDMVGWVIFLTFLNVIASQYPFNLQGLSLPTNPVDKIKVNFPPIKPISHITVLNTPKIDRSQLQQQVLLQKDKKGENQNKNLRNVEKKYKIIEKLEKFEWQQESMIEKVQELIKDQQFPCQLKHFYLFQANWFINSRLNSIKKQPLSQISEKQVSKLQKLSDLIQSQQIKSNYKQCLGLIQNNFLKSKNKIAFQGSELSNFLKKNYGQKINDVDVDQGSTFQFEFYGSSIQTYLSENKDIFGSSKISQVNEKSISSCLIDQKIQYGQGVILQSTPATLLVQIKPDLTVQLKFCRCTRIYISNNHKQRSNIAWKGVFDDSGKISLYQATVW